MKIITNLVLCLGLACSLNIFACPDKATCKCAAQSAEQTSSPQQADCPCAKNECKKAN